MEVIIGIIIVYIVAKIIRSITYNNLKAEVLKELGFSHWNVVSYFDEHVTVKSRQTLEKYDDVKFFKENREKFEHAENVLKRKNEVARLLRNFLNDNEFKKRFQYRRLVKELKTLLDCAEAYRICVRYI